MNSSREEAWGDSKALEKRLGEWGEIEVPQSSERERLTCSMRKREYWAALRGRVVLDGQGDEYLIGYRFPLLS